jgi:hypothetical protein
MRQLSVSSADSASEDYGQESETDERDFDLTSVLAAEQTKLPPHLLQLCMPPDQLSLKSKSWRTTNRKRFADRKKIGFVEAQKEQLPPEVLR